MNAERVVSRVFITGAAGAGSAYFIEFLKTTQPAVEIHGMVRRLGRVETAARFSGVRLYEADLLDTASIIKALRKARPDVILHMGGNPDKAFTAPSAMLMNNAVGTANLFEASLLANDQPPVIINVSSSEVYGAVLPEETPITEDCPKRPVSPYAVAKLAQDNLAGVYFLAYDLPVITLRSFTYLNNNRPDLFTSAFARQIALIEAGRQDVLRHGNLDSVRTLMGPTDVARAYWLAATRGRFGEAYNIGGDCVTTVGNVLEKLMDLCQWPPGRLTHKIEDPALLRPTDVTLQVPDSSKFRAETGWEPAFDLDAALRDLLDHWRREVVQ